METTNENNDAYLKITIEYVDQTNDDPTLNWNNVVRWCSSGSSQNLEDVIQSFEGMLVTIGYQNVHSALARYFNQGQPYARTLRHEDL